jgi:hypothetical protein
LLQRNFGEPSGSTRPLKGMSHGAISPQDVNRRYGGLTNASLAGKAVGITPNAVAASVIKPMNEQAWTNRVGDEFNHIFQSAAQAQARAMHARQMRSRAHRLGLVDPGHLAEKATQLWGSNGGSRLENLARQAAFRLTTGGVTALQTVLHPRDPLERHLLLSKMSEYLGSDQSPAQQDLERSVQQLHQQHGDELLALNNSAAAFAQLNDASPAATATAAGLRSIFLDAGRMPGDAVITATRLAKGLLEKFDGQTFESALRQLGEGVLADLRSPQPSRHAERVGVALTNAGAFMTVRMSLGVARDLKTRLASQGKMLPQSEPRIACTLLESAESGCADAPSFCGALFGTERASEASGNLEVLSSLRQTVQAMPNTWWTADSESSRFQLLEDLDVRMSVLGASGKSPEKDLASRLRERLAANALPEGTQT